MVPNVIMRLHNTSWFFLNIHLSAYRVNAKLLERFGRQRRPGNSLVNLSRGG